MIRSLLSAAAALVALSGVLAAQTPTKVPRLTDDMKAHEWYVEQARLWQNETERNPSNPQAWYNYYRAVRYTNITDTTPDWEAQRERVDQIANAMERVVPNTFEYHIVRWAIGGNDRSLFHHLERALELNPDYSIIAPDLISYYELGGDRDKVKLYARKWYETKSLSPSLFEYTRNVLASLDENAIIFTAGDLDTYPIWLLQYARGMRPDVTVINTSLVMVPEYREWLLREHDIQGDASLLDAERLATTSVAEAQGAFIRSIAEKTVDRPVYTALTMPPDQIQAIEKNLYVVGLANRYSAKRLDNIALVERAWRTFRLDYLDGLTYDESYGFDRSWLPRMNMNYVAPALLLFEHCSTASRTSEAQGYASVILKLARAAGQEAELQEQLHALEQEAKGSTATLDLVENGSAAEESALSRAISVYPNPTARQVTVAMPSAAPATMRLVGLDGATVREITTSERTISIDLTNVPSGSYLLKITTEGGEATKRIEVKR